MKKIALFVFLFSALSVAVTPFTYNWTIKLTGDTATVTKWKANNDSVLAFSSRVSDTLNMGVPRWKGFSNHDSTFKWMNIDTIPSADTIAVNKLNAEHIDSVPDTVRAIGFSGNLRGDVAGSVVGASVTGGALIGGTVSGTSGAFSSTVTVDSLMSTNGITATTLTGNVVGNVTGNVVGNVTGNVVGNVTGNASGTAATVTGATQSAITSVGTLTSLTTSGNLNADSIHSTKGITATNATIGGLNANSFGLYIGANAASATVPLWFTAPASTAINMRLWSGGAASSSAYSFGRGGEDALIGCAGITNDFVPGSVQGDVVLANYNSGNSILSVIGGQTVMRLRAGVSIGSATDPGAGNLLVGGTAAVDSLYSTKGISFGAGITATTGTFSSVVAVDSLKSTRGILLVGGGLIADSLKAGTGGWFRCDTGSFACTLSAVSGTYGTNKDTIGICYYSKIGRIVSMQLYSVDVEGVATNIRIKGFPTSLIPNHSNHTITYTNFPGVVCTANVVLGFHASGPDYVVIYTYDANINSSNCRVTNPNFSYYLGDF